MMEAICSSETSILTRTTRRHIPEDDIPHSHRRENLKSYNISWRAHEIIALIPVSIVSSLYKRLTCAHLPQNAPVAKLSAERDRSGRAEVRTYRWLSSKWEPLVDAFLAVKNGACHSSPPQTFLPLPNHSLVESWTSDVTKCIY
jgi:hypothetical protein